VAHLRGTVKEVAFKRNCEVTVAHLRGIVKEVAVILTEVTWHILR